MPSDATRRLLRIFGMAVTGFEDTILEGKSPKERAQAETEARARLQEVAALIDRLSRGESESSSLA